MSYKNAKYFDKGKLSQEVYHERTKRNHFFIGGTAGQEEIRKLKIGVAGLGGMGSNIAETLVRMGVGHLRITDPDTVDVSNIQRQVIANRESVGQSKAKVLRNELLKIADDFELVTYLTGITEDTVEEFVEGCDIIVDEIDVYPLNAHIMLHKAARKRNIPVYSAYILGMGIRFYKFVGNDFTFEDLIQSIPKNRLTNPPGKEVVEIFSTPHSSYMDQTFLSGFQDEIDCKRVPIFGPAALVGHATVCIRLLLDVLLTKSPEKLGLLTKIEPTPVLPEYLAIDLADLTVKKGKKTKSP
jgi:molybdopterin/thiamine biosynthesis adenylyltransferase